MAQNAKFNVGMNVTTEFKNAEQQISKLKNQLKDIRVDVNEQDLKNSVTNLVNDLQKSISKIRNFKLTTGNASEYEAEVRKVIDGYKELDGLYGILKKSADTYYDNNIKKLKAQSEQAQKAYQAELDKQEKLKAKIQEEKQKLEKPTQTKNEAEKTLQENKTLADGLKQEKKDLEDYRKGLEDLKKTYDDFIKDHQQLKGIDFSKSFSSLGKSLQDGLSKVDWENFRKDFAQKAFDLGAIDKNSIAGLKDIEKIFSTGDTDKKIAEIAKQLENLDKNSKEASKALNQAKTQIKQIQGIKKDNTGIYGLEKEFEDSAKRAKDLQKNAKAAAEEVRVFESSTGHLPITDEFKTMSESLDDIGQNISEDITKALNEEATQKAADAIKNLTNRFLSFSAVLYTGRKAIKQFTTTMSDLDKSLTTIAAVTGRSRQEMWDMVGTYNEMAQRLGTTTSQITEASKLYYQQGRNDAEVTKLVEQTAVLAATAQLDYAQATDYLTAAVNGFKMEAQEAVEITDTWSALAANAAVDVEELAVSISKVASLAENAGMSMQTTSAFLTQMISTTREAPIKITFL